MKTAWRKTSDVLSWVFLFCMIGLLIFTITTTAQAKKTGESAYLFGYRPVLVLTGSMEPYMMTNGVALTKEVSDISELEVGDVVTYHMQTEAGRQIRITHRIISMDNGTIRTKGDNNRVEDGYDLTMENIESEVVAVFNQTAWLAQKWQTTSGKVMIISFSAGTILLYCAVKSLIKSFFTDEKDEESEETEHFSDPAEHPETPDN